jgi:hypothetical protein
MLLFGGGVEFFFFLTTVLFLSSYNAVTSTLSYHPISLFSFMVKFLKRAIYSPVPLFLLEPSPTRVSSSAPFEILP